VLLDPQAVAICERIRRAGGGGFAGRTVAEIRHEGLQLAGTWALDDESLAIVAHLSRNGPSTAQAIAVAEDLDPVVTEGRLHGLREAGFVRRRWDVQGRATWTGIIAGSRRPRADVTGALALLQGDAEPTPSTHVPEGQSLHSLAPGLEVKVYRPEVEVNPPVVLFVHGGGWVSGSIAAYDTFCQSIVELSGCALASVGYRLAPEHPFPAPLDDALVALRWLVENDDVLGVDAARLAVMGDSAGGNLAVVAALMVRDEAWCDIRLQVLLYPVLDATMSSPSVEEHAFAPLFCRDDLCWIFDKYGAPDGDWRGSPIDADDVAGAPPALVITADVDPVRDDGARYVDRLRDAGVDAEVVNVKGAMHGFASFAPALDTAIAARLRIAEALRTYLQPAVTP
jgi:acetyl esterase